MIDIYRLRRAAVRLANMILKGKFTEAARLIVHRTRFLIQARREKRRTASRPVVPIDARTELLDPAGNVVAKRSLVYPGSAPRRASIVIPCYNYGAYLMEAVDSARAQTLADTEIIVVDDGSTDPGTLAILDGLRDQPDLCVVRKPNGGLVSARNAGIERATGEYVCCLDADDRLLPTYLEAAVLAAEADRAVGFAYSWVRLFGDDDEVWETRDFNIWQALQDNHTAVCAVFRRDDWIAAGFYDSRMREGYEDWEFWLRLANLGRKGKVVRAPLFEHRRHGRTMTHDAHGLREKLIDRMRGLNPQLFNSSHRQELIAGVRARAESAAGKLAVRVRPSLEPEKPHLLVIVPWLAAGGAEMVLLDILRGLGGRWRVTVVTTLHDNQPMWAAFRAVAADIFPMAGAFEGEAGLALVVHLAESRGTKVIFSSGSDWLYRNAAALRSRLPSVATIDLLHNALPEGHIASAVAASPAIDRHIAVAPHIREALLAYRIPPGKIDVIVNGVEASGACLDSERRTAARAKLGLPEKTFAIGWVGRYSEEKAPLDFVKAVASIAGGKRISAFMCGDGPMAADVEAAIALRKAPVTMLGQRPREAMPDLYAAFDVLVLTSAVEGLPLVVMEALGAGCPVIATDVGDVPLLIEDGVNGFLVAAGDVEAICRALEKMMTSGAAARKKMVEEAYRSIAEGGFSLGEMQKRYAALFAGVADSALQK